MKKYLIIGSGAAGIAAVSAIRALDKEGTITIITGESSPYYYKPRLAELIAGQVTEEQVTVNKPQWYVTSAVEMVYSKTVVSIDRSLQNVTVNSGEHYAYDELLLATGARAALPPVSGITLKNVFSLRTIADARAIKTAAAAKPSVVVIGGGLLALEAAFNLQKIGCAVTVIEMLPRLLPRQLDVAGASVLQKKLEQSGMSFNINRQVKAINGIDAVTSVTLDSGDNIAAQMVLVSAGISPDTTLACQSGLSVRRGIVVNEFLETADQHIHAAGDCAEVNGRMWGLWTTAMKQGAVAGAAMAGKKSAFTDLGNTTQLKITGISLVSSGIIEAAQGQYDSVVCDKEGSYRTVSIENGHAMGLILLGDTSNSKQLLDLVNKKADVTAIKHNVLDPQFSAWPS